ncbi:aspartate/glutamate racemase family protein [Aurantibacter crassamenti]|uniref:aspartate/glutamate racemase family protein n=1 Tax=Aurantibacter crassamenti TaxID=1837375 RepID=UPI0019395A49|nr:aspartate/glutamate racemase family protein [Aurantibacter crassamenti]MBM1105624.1 aspartate/glutamate racemase family protein [Aurantibacter crassamenti]
MKKRTLGFVHTSATLVPLFQQLTNEYLSDVDTFNIADDSIIKDVIKKGELTPNTAARVVNHIQAAEAAGADVILATCSSIGSAIETAATLCNIPVIRVDQAMADEAVQISDKIGVIATLPTTLGPTSDLVKRRAEAAGKKVTITSILCEGAFEALMSGDAAKHDETVATALKSLIKEVDVIVLAQASMARVVDTLTEDEKSIPILASPAIAMKKLAETHLK